MRFSRSFTRFSIASVLLSATIFSCTDDDMDEPLELIANGNPQIGSFNINPSSFPNGGGLSFSEGGTGAVQQVDEATNFDWDLQMLAIRTSSGGRPAIFLKGDVRSMENAVSAVNVSESSGIGLGEAGFEAFETATQEMVDALAFDEPFDFDVSGGPDADLLAEAYQGLVIGDKNVNLDTDEQPVFLVRTASGSFYKFQLVERSGGGAVTVQWEGFE